MTAISCVLIWKTPKETAYAECDVSAVPEERTGYQLFLEPETEIYFFMHWANSTRIDCVQQ